MPTQPKINLQGALDTFKKSNDALIPVFEAISNSLEAIAAKDFSKGEEPTIELKLDYSGNSDGPRNLEAVIIEDNGVGFTNENYSRFEEFINKSKGFNNRGTGRLQFLHRFEQIKVESAFVDKGTKKRTFKLNPTNFITSHELTEYGEDVSSYSKVTMLRPKFSEKDSERFEHLSAHSLAEEIRQRYLLRFFLDEQDPQANLPNITIIFSLNGEETEPVIVWEVSLPKPEKTGSLSINYSKVQDATAEKPVWTSVRGKFEKINWAQFKFSDSEQKKNKIFLCSKNVAVQKVPFSDLKVNDTFEGSRFLTFFYGEVLDRPENVSDSVDSFTFPQKSNVEQSLDDLFFDPEREYLFMEDITSGVSEELSHIYADVISKKQRTADEVSSIARAHAIPADVARSISISASDDEKTITTKLFTEQGRRQAQKAYDAKKIVESLTELNPITDTYQNELHQKIVELSSLVDEQNKEELGRYVIRREMISELLNAIIFVNLDIQTAPDNEADQRRDKEGLVHDLIFKRKASTKSLNDLWILNEEFLHFEGTSEIALNKIETESGEKLLKTVPKAEIEAFDLKLTRRPDIYLFLEEGKCVIVELKAPDVDLSAYLNQMSGYCTLIANYSQKPISSFFCYLIGETFNPLVDLNDYDETVTGDFIRQNMPIRSVKNRNDIIANQQVEIIKLSSLYARAKRRNKSFADKLGVSEMFDKS